MYVCICHKYISYRLDEKYMRCVVLHMCGNLSYRPVCLTLAYLRGCSNVFFADIRVSKWTDAVADCDLVLNSEPSNLKAKLRRACAYKSLRKFRLAKDDLDSVLNVEPNNKRAQVHAYSATRPFLNFCNEH